MLEKKLTLRMIRCLVVSCAMASCWSSPLFADISLPRIFSDHMVLQQNTQVEIWGIAEANEKIEINFDDQTVSVTANGNGDWTGSLQTPAAGGPYQVEVKSKVGETKVVLNDVMIGEVWICGGQNNMEFPATKTINSEVELQKAKDFSGIRFFTVGHTTATERFSDIAKADGWNVCNPDSVAQFSAVSYFFGRNLAENLEVPVGLIHVAKSGTPCEAWTSRESLENKPELAELLKHWEENDDPTDHNRPSNLFNGMVAPLKGTKFRGFIWYQGESNVGRGKQYATLFPLLIETWRQELNQNTAPFLFVQLAPRRYDARNPADLAEIWDAQLNAHRDTPNTGIVITTDIGDPESLEPENKQEVGRRLALWAFAKIYPDALRKKEIMVPSAYCGPLYKSMEKVEGSNKIKIFFDHTADGLECRGSEVLTHFLICGNDQQFVPAKAVILDGAIIVSADEVQEPIAVRFAWDDSAVPNLFNSAGLPASPFRTDDFDLLSNEVHF
jgi:sialate O-acetylesterase